LLFIFLHIPDICFHDCNISPLVSSIKAYRLASFKFKAEIGSQVTDSMSASGEFLSTISVIFIENGLLCKYQKIQLTKPFTIMSERPVHERIKELSEALVQLSDKVVENLFNALLAVKHQDEQGARQIRIVDDEIDVAEVNLEERCLAFLALQQPVAIDLRTIVAIIKINDHLERIGDLAVHIIDRMPEISPEMLESFEFDKMGIQAGEMVKQSIEAFIAADRFLAGRVNVMDEVIDAMHRKVFRRVALLMKSPDSDSDELIALLSISRYIERIADHAVRIANEAVFLVTGEIMRHNAWSYEKPINSTSE
jgi:phosphate transport system protein